MKSKPVSILSTIDSASGYVKLAENCMKRLDTAPMSKGRDLLKKYLSGEVLSNALAIKAKCCECSGLYMDGRVDCGICTCPLYPHMPYGQMRKRYVRPENRK
jgi:hypothetical protein